MIINKRKGHLIWGLHLVDFKKLLGEKELKPPIDPLIVFTDLDKESGKEYLRPSQERVLKEWHENFRNQNDVIVKLHTGQGKTLIGLLMLQSSINEGNGPAVYICPNNYLVAQTIEQARSFGINTVQFKENSSGPPREFMNSEAILVTNCNKLFNGKSVFGVLGSSRELISLGAIVMDDAHTCIEKIRESFSIRVNRKNDGEKNSLYEGLWWLFEESLSRQAPGTCKDIEYGENTFMAVPYWIWHAREDQVLELLRKYKETELLFVWDLLKDKIKHCICVFSGSGLEITPRLLPLELIPSFTQAKRRIFLSATLTEDAFLVRDLGIDPQSVTNPLSSGDVKYSGERLILMPTLVDSSLGRERIISWLSQIAAKNGNFGVVSIVPSFYRAGDWEKLGANKTEVKTLQKSIENLKTNVNQKSAKKILVLVNEYDGVDLPDNTCRILCVDSLPAYTSLIDKYMQEMRPTSKTIRRRHAQRIEQGIGRAIRGSSDWCIVIIIGNDITNFLSEKIKREYLSNEAQTQINIGEELALEITSEGGRLNAIEKLINQCLSRNLGWKGYYKTRMAKVETKEPNKEYLNQAILERESEALYQQGHCAKAVKMLQKFIDSHGGHADTGWFTQLMATYICSYNLSRSVELQLKAHTENGRLFRPEEGVDYSKLIAKGTTAQASRIIKFVKEHESHNALIVHINDILDKITWSTAPKLCEDGIDELGVILGFPTQMPERNIGTGPDNLWQIDSKKYWIIECKNRVSIDRKDISKSEVGQMDNSFGWFKENYEGCLGVPVMVHPTKTLARDAYPVEPFLVLLPDTLEHLKKNVRGFYNSLKEFFSRDLSLEAIKQRLKTYNLVRVELDKYLRQAKSRKR
ncbi:MAG: hypothetical protein CEE41_01705 [Hadesarchaea archaeon B3_Hades]|nr:MAG: hypothetical protein CEE41_01705 [Hadesarchaea archaeon B3_Hades]